LHESIRRPGFRIEVVRLEAPLLRRGGRALRFAQLSDLHLRRLDGRHERLLAELNARAFDFIFVTGDCVSRRATTWRTLARFLERLPCPGRAFACRGNWEIKYDAPRPAHLRRLFRAGGVELLINESRTLATDVGSVRVAAVDDIVRGWPDFEAALCDGPAADLNILLAHEPLAARLLPPGAAVDLILSGHTHGGQIGLPWLWRLALPSGSGGFRQGLYEVDGHRLYVNRGFGTTEMPPLRVLCPAEATFFEVSPYG